MKHMKTIKRVSLVLISLVLLVGVLASCGNSNKALDTVKKAGDGEGCQVYFTRILTLEGAESAREAFVAASRGYNMLAEGFDDSKVGTAEDPKDPNAVAVEVGGVTYTVSMDGAKAAMNLLKPSTSTKNVSEGDVAAFDATLAAMSAADVVAVVEMMRGDNDVDLSGNGFPQVILVWVGAFLRLLTNLTGGYYVWALFFFAVVVEIALLYFAIKQQKTAQKQASLKPKEMAIRKKYAGRKDQKSQQALQQELQAFYQQEGVNMFGGCLPLLLQMPILIALYNIVINPLRYVLGKGEGIVNAVNKFATTSRAAGGLGMSLSDSARGSIQLLSQIEDPEKLAAIKNFAWFSNGEEIAQELSDVAGNLPNFNMFGLNTGLTPGFQKPYLLLLIPVLTFVAYFFSMKLTRKLSYQPMAQDAQMGCANNMMDIMMPLMSVYFTFIMPAAVGIYWIFKCLITTVKQLVLHKLMPMPVFTEEDFKRAEREMKGKLRPEERAPLAGRATGAKKSLHSIDDEDDLPVRNRNAHDYGEEEDSIYERRAKEAAQKQADDKAKRLEAAQLKSDRKNNKKK